MLEELRSDLSDPTEGGAEEESTGGAESPDQG